MAKSERFEKVDISFGNGTEDVSYRNVVLLKKMRKIEIFTDGGWYIQIPKNVISLIATKK